MLYSKEKIEIQNTEFDLSVYLKRTRNLSYRIHPGKISITLPLFYRQPSTIQKYRDELLAQAILHIEKKPVLSQINNLWDASTISIMGIPYKVIITPEIKSLIIDKLNLRITTNSSLDYENEKSRFYKSIERLFLEDLKRRVHYINSITTKKNINSIKLKNNISTWGTCSSQNDITISVNTILAPIWVMDYVIVHELCHMIHHDHSAVFWRVVKSFYPRYKEAVLYLKENKIGF